MAYPGYARIFKKHVEIFNQITPCTKISDFLEIIEILTLTRCILGFSGLEILAKLVKTVLIFSTQIKILRCSEHRQEIF